VSISITPTAPVTTYAHGLLAPRPPAWNPLGRGASGDLERVVAAARVRAWSAPKRADLAQKWRWLAELGRYDLVVARLAEGHADALAIIDEAGDEPVADALYGVWASASGGTGVRAEPVPDGWRLGGRLRFCTGARHLDRALVTVRTFDDELLLLDVDLRAGGWRPIEGTWPAVGMDLSDSLDVEADAVVPARAQIGPARFYLDRPGFPLGGIGVAAVWLGGAAGVLDTIADGLRRFEPDHHQLAQLGQMSTAVLAADAVLAQATSATSDLAALALRVRSTVEEAVRVVLDLAPRLTGPAPLCRDPEYAHRISDLLVYVRQHHAERDLAALGTAILDSGPFGRTPQ
jgi:alkylation response protein AidB-like acyl-CoA dehydrogenase